MTMTFRAALFSAIAVAFAGGLGFFFFNQGTASDTPLSDKERAVLEDVIRDYLLENPDVVIEAIDNYNALEALRAEAEAMAGIDTHLETLVSGVDGYAAGAPREEAKVTVIELFDYHCGFCKQATDYVYALLEEEDDVRVIFRELPILREESDFAAKAALAARDQDKYAELHFAMMNASGILTAGKIDAIAKDVGVDLPSLHATIDGQDYEPVLSRTREIAMDIGVTGTPAFLIASADGSYSRLISGWQPELLNESIEEARKAGS